ncbi:ECF-type sigma factor [Synechococcus sp. PCC 7502]|uniref:ECF-type sigma factor n=1 Tax=Synechococcus sp. PCC 7502 TaxID=1173263 RepID=UPI0002F01B3A|nr:ECF-type sigma factor [Synechococcus sp. PCC 7502]
MDKKSRIKIKEAALLIQEYATISHNLRAIAIESKDQKKLLAIAKALDQMPELLDPLFAKTLKLYMLMADGYSEAELAEKIGESVLTTKQRINALKAGGIRVSRTFKVAQTR